MDNSFGDSVFDFDLNFLDQTPKNIAPLNGHEKQRRAISLVKKKILATNTLIERYNKKKKYLEEAERALQASKEECKQLCINNQNISDRLLQLENENLSFKTHCQELEHKCSMTQSQFGALQSHSNQLQLLVKENEIMIDTLKLENKSEKSTFVKGKRQMNRLTRKNKLLVKNISLLKDVVFGKKKVTEEIRAIFNIFETVDNVHESHNSDSEEEQNTEMSEWNEVTVSLSSSDITEKNAEILNKEAFSDVKSVVKSKDNDEVTSEDTGRGSSLAFSDSEKYLQSPDYFMNDSPVNTEFRSQKSADSSPVNIPYTSTTNSPIDIYKRKVMDIVISDNEKHCLSKTVKCGAAENPRKTVDRAVSPIQYTEPNTKTTDFATSPIFFEDFSTKSIETITIDQTVDEEFPCIITNREDSCSPFKGFSREEIENVVKTVNDSEKYCLKINNSKNLCDENSSDKEIEMILGSMRLEEKMITPMIVTPVTQREIENPHIIETQPEKPRSVVGVTQGQIEKLQIIQPESQPVKPKGHVNVAQRKIEELQIIQPQIIETQPENPKSHVNVAHRKIEELQIIQPKTIESHPVKPKGHVGVTQRKIEKLQIIQTDIIETQPEKPRSDVVVTQGQIEKLQIIQPESQPIKPKGHGDVAQLEIEELQIIQPQIIECQPVKPKAHVDVAQLEIEELQIIQPQIIECQPVKPKAHVDVAQLEIEELQIIQPQIIECQPVKPKGHVGVTQHKIEELQIIQPQIIETQPEKPKGDVGITQRKIEKQIIQPEIIESQPVKSKGQACEEYREDTKMLKKHVAYLLKEMALIKCDLNNIKTPESVHTCNKEVNSAHDLLYQPKIQDISSNKGNIYLENLEEDPPIETFNIPQDEAPFDGDAINDLVQPEELFDLDPPIETCNIIQPNDFDDFEQVEENLDFDPPIETCNITQPIETFDICPPLSPELTKDTTGLNKKRKTSESSTDLVLNRMRYEESTSSFEDTNMIQSNSGTASPDIIRYNYEESNSKIQQSTSPGVNNVSLPDAMNEETPKKDNLKTKEKLRKLTKLEKMRRKLIPKTKIKEAESPLKRSPRLSSIKKSVNTNPVKPKTKRLITDQDNSATLNDKDVYEKAVKVMADSNYQQKDTNCPRVSKFIKPVKNIKCSSSELVINKKRASKTTPEKCDISIDQVSPMNNVPDIPVPKNRNSGHIAHTYRNGANFDTRKHADRSSESSTDSVSNHMQFEKSTSSFKYANMIQSNSKTASRDVLRYSYEESNNVETQQSASPCVNNVSLSNAMNEETPEKDSHKPKEKLRKLTKLEKMRNKLIPKTKIKDSEAPVKRSLRLSSSKLYITENPVKLNNETKKVITEQDNSATLNDKNVYEKALKVMAASNSQQKDTECSPTRKFIKPIKNIKSSSSELVINKNIPSKTTPEKCEIANDQVFSPENNVINISVAKNRTSERIARTVKNGTDYETRKTRKRSAADKELGIQNKRILRSSFRLSESETNGTAAETKDLNSFADKDNQGNTLFDNLYPSTPIKDHKEAEYTRNNNKIYKPQNRKDYNIVEQTHCSHPKYSLLCRVIDNFASSKGRRQPKKCTESISNKVCKTIENGLARIIELTTEETKPATERLADELSKWKLNNFLLGLMKYLKNPERKIEMYNKANCFPAPPMTKSEQILLYVLITLEKSNPWKENDVIFRVLDAMDYTMFHLHNTPEFDVVESMSHFYAVLCRFKKAKSRLRLFMLDAMYCTQFKSIPLIKQCMEVWMHILPLAHMPAAQSTLVICLVYLLHFYKCEDRMKRVLEIRMFLQKKYFFQITEWNDLKILEMFRKSIVQLRDIPIERKMLRIALIILAKRMGPKWCQNNIIKKLLLPLIESANVSRIATEFCISILGPIMRPYPVEMKIHCEIVVNLLLDMLNQNATLRLQEAIFTSLLYIRHGNFNRIFQELLSWNPSYVSPEFEELFKDFVKSKPIKTWKVLLSKVPLN